MDSFKTYQEEFWAGSFGDSYTERNQGPKILSSNIHLFGKIIPRLTKVQSAIEFGANIGLNLVALKRLLPSIELSGIEINKKASDYLEKLDFVKVYKQSILDFDIDYQRDLVFTKGVLIHMSPTELPYVYQLMYKTASKYVLMAEYYSPTPQAIPYRGHDNTLFKRDFAGEMMDLFPDLKLIDYGFAYHRDRHFPQDDITWFLLEK